MSSTLYLAGNFGLEREVHQSGWGDESWAKLANDKEEQMKRKRNLGLIVAIFIFQLSMKKRNSVYSMIQKTL